jgi:hypothetical protein
MKRTVRLGLFVTLLTVVANACGGDGDDSTGPDADAAVGVYTLSTINGRSLPQVVETNGNDTAEITQGVVTLRSDNTFSDVTQLRITISGQVSMASDSATGTWSRQNNTISLNPTGFSPYFMTWDGSTRLTQTIDVLTLVYIK